MRNCASLRTSMDKGMWEIKSWKWTISSSFQEYGDPHFSITENNPTTKLMIMFKKVDMCHSSFFFFFLFNNSPHSTWRNCVVSSLDAETHWTTYNWWEYDSSQTWRWHRHLLKWFQGHISKDIFINLLWINLKILWESKVTPTNLAPKKELHTQQD